jgi:dihydrodipicolinate synthase/N-acetylneuraminate lyase
MIRRLTRRQFIGRSAVALLATRSLASGGWPPRPPMAPTAKPFRGIFAILETPFTASEQMDEEDLAREVDFCARGGAHGLVWPQLAAEFYLLSEEERMRGAEVVIRAAAGRSPIVIGVQAPFKEIAIKLAQHAERKGADALISLPPYLGHTGLDTAGDYYRSLAHAVKLPIFIQNSGGQWGPAMSTEFVIQLAREFPQLAYIKEEVDPVPHRLEEYARSAVMKGIFSGDAGRNLLNELPRGSSGTMPACEFVDIAAQVYNLAAAGKAEEADQLFEKLLPMINLENTYGMVFAKAILVKRGVFKTARMRNRSGVGLDKFDEQELAIWWKELQPYFKV